MDFSSLKNAFANTVDSVQDDYDESASSWSNTDVATNVLQNYKTNLGLVISTGVKGVTTMVDKAKEFVNENPDVKQGLEKMKDSFSEMVDMVKGTDAYNNMTDAVEQIMENPNVEKVLDTASTVVDKSVERGAQVLAELGDFSSATTQNSVEFE
jgi:hypothetical protein